DGTVNEVEAGCRVTDGRGAIDTGHECDTLTGGLERLGDLEGDGRAERVARYRIGSVGLAFTDGGDVRRDHLVEAGEAGFPRIETSCAQREERPVVGEVAGQSHEYQHFAGSRMNAEQGRFTAR